MDDIKRWDLMTYRPTTNGKSEAYRLGRAFMGKQPGVINIKLELLPTPNTKNVDGMWETWATLIPYEDK
jgi:hypothetical protein